MGDNIAYQKPEILIVLGANQKVLIERLQKALEVAKKFPDIPLVLSGGGRTVQLESAFMYNFLVTKGIRHDRLIREEFSLDTVGNAVFSKFLIREAKLANRKNILVITSSFHGPRSLYIFKEVFGPNYAIAVAVQPTRVSPPTLETRAISELNGEIYLKNTIFNMPFEITAWSTKNYKLTGDECGILAQMFIYEPFYMSRWDIARRFSPDCE
jgi:uncharacterized SAM-binding protein YcdF (DUF218 family)